ncbi:MAG TPA: hypothetical protein VJV78_14170 [Polyangiales bacterium]|nr:hypothetical protein [Polyangiales bacterium]
MLERNELHLTAIKLLAPHLTQANHVDVLERARTKSKREVEALVAELAPKPDVPSVVRKLPGARPSVFVCAGCGTRSGALVARRPARRGSRGVRS